MSTVTTRAVKGGPLTWAEADANFNNLNTDKLEINPALGTPVSGTLTNCTGLPVSTGVAGLGTGVAAALAVNVGSAGAPVVLNGALGTPSSGVGTNLTGTAAGLTAGNVTTNANLTGHVTSVGNAAVLGSFTLAQLNSAISDGDVSAVSTGTTSSTFTFDGSGGSTGSLTLSWQKIGNFVTLNVPTAVATSGTSSTVLTSNTALSSTVRPTSLQVAEVNTIRNNGASINAPGVISVGTDGILKIYRDAGSTAWTNSSECGVTNNFSITYFIG